MPNWRLRFSDDFSGHADQAAMEAAYVPGLFNDPTGVYFCTWGGTAGPDGDEGALAVWNGIDLELNDLSRQTTGQLQKCLFGGLLEGLEYKVVARLDNSLDFVRIFAYWLDEPSVGNDDLSSALFRVTSGKVHASSVYGGMTVQRPNNGGPSLVTTQYPGEFPQDTPQTITIEFKLSTTSDGYLIVKRDSTTVHSETGINLYDSGHDPSTYPFNYVEVSPGGRIGLLEVYDTTPTPNPDPGELMGPTPEPCCGDSAGTGPLLPPTVSDWDAACAGGGTVPTAADLTDAENWDD
jgi:hypothetical protein